MAIDKKYVDQIIKVSEKAALASSYLVGKKDKIAADQAAVDSMRFELNKIDMNGEVVIGEGSLDEAPMLYTGEKLGNKNGPYFDIAVDPLEGTNFAANNLPGATSVIAIAEKGNLFNAPETYMDKIATVSIEKGLVDLDFSLKKNLTNLADFVSNTSAGSVVSLLLFLLVPDSRPPPPPPPVPFSISTTASYRDTTSSKLPPPYPVGDWLYANWRVNFGVPGVAVVGVSDEMSRGGRSTLISRKVTSKETREVGLSWSIGSIGSTALSTVCL